MHDQRWSIRTLNVTEKRENKETNHIFHIKKG